MREYQRKSEREERPARRPSGGFKAGRPKERFSRDSHESMGRPGGNFRRENDRSSRPSPEMHDVVCDKCGKECTVPFKPAGNKSVYCSDCFRKNDDSFAKNGSESRGRPNHSAEDLAKINQKLDKIMQALKIE